MAYIGVVNTATGQNVDGVPEGDARLTNARTPTAHAASHATGQADALAPANIGAEVAGAAAAVQGNLSTHAGLGAGSAHGGVEPAGAVSTHNGLGTAAHGGICASNDARLSDARTPTAHTHGSYSGQVEWCQGLFYNSNDGGALYKRGWRITVADGIVTNIESLGAYKINSETP